MPDRVKVFLVILLAVFCLPQVLAQRQAYDNAVSDYIDRFQKVAIREMELYRIPASITLAQGIIESDAGRSDLAREANNHFGIKCHQGWTGMTFHKDDDTRQECFRKYGTAWESYRDHSLFLTGRDRYRALFNLDPTDYRGWANGLKAAGYATNPAYPQMLVRTIETYSLHLYDQSDRIPAIVSVADTVAHPSPGSWIGNLLATGVTGGQRIVYENNRLKLVLAREDDNIYLISRDVGVPVDKLLLYNDLVKSTALQPGQAVYLEKKRRKGTVDSHTVTTGEMLSDLSQRYGVRLKVLARRNGLEPGETLQAGTVLSIR